MSIITGWLYYGCMAKLSLVWNKEQSFKLIIQLSMQEFSVEEIMASISILSNAPREGQKGDSQHISGSSYKGGYICIAKAARSFWLLARIIVFFGVFQRQGAVR